VATKVLHNSTYHLRALTVATVSITSDLPLSLPCPRKIAHPKAFHLIYYILSLRPGEAVIVIVIVIVIIILIIIIALLPGHTVGPCVQDRE
jgi:hypothetical protein